MVLDFLFSVLVARVVVVVTTQAAEVGPRLLLIEVQKAAFLIFIAWLVLLELSFLRCTPGKRLMGIGLRYDNMIPSKYRIAKRNSLKCLPLFLLFLGTSLQGGMGLALSILGVAGLALLAYPSNTPSCVHDRYARVYAVEVDGYSKRRKALRFVIAVVLAMLANVVVLFLAWDPANNVVPISRPSQQQPAIR